MDWLNDDPRQWQPLFDYCMKLGLCLHEKAVAVLAFPGISKSSLLDRLNPDGTLCLNLYRKIHHLKFSFDGETVRNCKIYLAVSQPEIDLNGLVQQPQSNGTEAVTPSVHPLINSW